jgi:drug/metabolite transporter (DMT)-like permease
MFLTTWHMFVATCVTQVMGSTTNMLTGVREKKVNSDSIRTKVMPVAFFFSISLVLSNKAYIYLSVSYIQMLKACTPVAVLIMSFLLGLEKPSYLEVYIVSLICIGVAMTSVGETYFSMIGFTFQALGILAESARLVLTNLLMKQLKLDPLSSLYYTAPVCFAFILPFCLYFESADLPYDRIFSSEFGGILLLNGFVAFMLNVAVVMLIGNTSALILTLAGIIKDLMLVFLSVALFASPVTPLQYGGYFIALVGLNAHKEYKKNADKFQQTLKIYATAQSDTQPCS